jgi:phenylpropionate dioxygenase-like ring-hydroxylating dioxygenase large terminal subunit
MKPPATEYPPVFGPLDFAERGQLRSNQAPRPLAQILREIAETGERALARASTLPAPAYTSEDVFDWEATHLLRGGWQCVGHVSQVPAFGDYVSLELLGEPLVMIRGKDGAVRVLSRVCPHRAMDIMPAGVGNTRILLCPYHAWTFELDGRLKACPEMHEAEGFARDDFRLMPFRTEVWQGFVFVNLDGAAGPLGDGLLAMGTDLGAFRLPELRLVVSREWDCRFNWKVLVENFMESYHHLGIHHRTLQPMMPARDTWTEGEKRHYVRAHLPYRDSVRAAYQAFEARGDFSEDPPPLPGLDAAQKSEWGLFLIHPTFLLATAPDRVIWYRLQPLGPSRLKLLTTVLVAPETADRPNFAQLRPKIEQALVQFHLEDMEVCSAVQRGLYASGWQPGRLSHLEMPVWLFHRYLAARIRGVWPTDDRPAAPSQRP